MLSIIFVIWLIGILAAAFGLDARWETHGLKNFGAAMLWPIWILPLAIYEITAGNRARIER